MRWYYYLHTNGELIGKNPVVVESGGGTPMEYFDSNFVRKVWEIDTMVRSTCWTLILEALALGAGIKGIKELIEKWTMDKGDSIEMLKRMKLAEMKPDELMKKGMTRFIKEVLGLDVEKYWAEIRTLGAKKGG